MLCNIVTSRLVLYRECVANTCQGVDISTVVKTTAAITKLLETVYDSMSRRPWVLSHVGVNLARVEQLCQLVLLDHCS